eukprot:NODE_35_length_36362_cov_0.944434.p13 type:complete len:304 gc:universal NODE_35_length_36362_cov_0.944434:5671-6582(+)
MKHFLSTIICSHLFFVPVLYFGLFFTSAWHLAIIYMIWIMLDRSPFKFGRYNNFMRNLRIFKNFGEFFSSEIVCDVPLEDKQYMFAYSPHGIIGTGSFLSFGTNANGLTKYYKRPVRVLTIDFNFYMPIFRDVFILLGYLSCSKETMQKNLKEGNSLVILPGGAQEVTYFDKNNINVIIDKRYGFFKLVIENGVDLVPVLGFGENDIHRIINISHPVIVKLQSILKTYFGFMAIPFIGEYGFIPYNKKLTTVIGSPISVKKNSKPLASDIRSLQEQYKAELLRVFDKYKSLYGSHVKSLKVVE